MKPLRYVYTVLWSFVGLGRREDAADVFDKGNPIGIVVVALILAAVFIGLLLFVAEFADSMTDAAMLE